MSATLMGSLVLGSAGAVAQSFSPAHDFELDADDEGLLTASEIAQLKLNADRFVPSACSTAVADGAYPQALSGLPRAFFYAGARVLLVSHWPVYSDAAVELTLHSGSAATREPNGSCQNRPTGVLSNAQG